MNKEDIKNCIHELVRESSNLYSYCKKCNKTIWDKKMNELEVYEKVKNDKISFDELKEEYQRLFLKEQELIKQNSDKDRKIAFINKGIINPRKDMLNLIPGKIYLIINDGRRIVGKLVFENKSYICYKKRDNTNYYLNKNFIKLIKELSPKEQKSYGVSNFGEDIEEDEY